MKKLLHILALILAVVLVFAAAQISRQLPADNQVLVEKKYSGWSGVLRGWISSRWSCSGSFTTWLNRCAGEFEKAHPGVYIEFTQVQESAFTDPGLRPPELAFYSPGVITDASYLLDAAPVCMGGYIWVYNSALCAGPPEQPICLPDDAGRSFSLASVALSGSAEEAETESPGIDLGLEAMADAAEISLDAFIRGELPALIVTQKELARLISLRDAGKGPDWLCAPTGEFMLADQLLLGGAVAGSRAEQAALAEEFIAFLRTEDCQAELSGVGAFSVTGTLIYPAHSPYSELETMLRSRTKFMPDFFSEYPPGTLDGNVRKFRSGSLSAELALGLTMPKTEP